MCVLIRFHIGKHKNISTLQGHHVSFQAFSLKEKLTAKLFLEALLTAREFITCAIVLNLIINCNQAGAINLLKVFIASKPTLNYIGANEFEKYGISLSFIELRSLY